MAQWLVCIQGGDSLDNTEARVATRLEDVAKLVGCSISTASRALAGNTAISPGMRDRIQEAAASIGYTAPLVGRKPRKTRTRTIGVVIDVLQNNPFMTQLLEHLNAALHESGYQVMLIMDSLFRQGSLAAARPIIDGYLDGMIFANATIGSKIVAELHERGMPIVLVVRSDGSNAIDSVEIDNVHAGAEAAKHLHELGHHKIGLVMGPQNTSTSRDRAEGALAFLASVGVGRNQVRQTWGEYTSESGYSASMGLLSGPDPVTAIIAANDTVALGVLEAAKRHGVDVPGRLSVIGFDDIPLAGSSLIGLTTIRQPVESMARLAARRLVDRLQLRGPAQAVRDILPIHLVKRASTGPAPVR